MAKIEKVIHADVETYEEVVTRTREVRTEEFVITIDRDTAEALMVVLGRVGGDPEGARGKIEPIFKGLQNEGVFWSHIPAWGRDPYESRPHLRYDGYGITFADPDGTLPSERVSK